MLALGLPSEKVMHQSCSKADKVIGFSEKDTGALAKLANRTTKLQINIQDGEVMVSAGDSIVYLTPLKWKGAA